MADRAKLVQWPEGRAISFECPGCKDLHQVPVEGPRKWGWNGSTERPTLTPSLLTRSGHYVTGVPASLCGICAENAAHPEGMGGFHCYTCHSFVTDGCIRFLGDCTHAMAGQTVDLPEIS